MPENEYHGGGGTTEIKEEASDRPEGLTNDDFRKLLMTPRAPSFYAKLQKQEDDKKAELEKKYRDRAGERRDGTNPDYQAEDPLSTASGYRVVAPDLRSGMDAAKRRHQMIKESKFLGGDMEHTHLVATMPKEKVEPDPRSPKGRKVSKKERDTTAETGTGQRVRPSSSSSNSGGAITSSVPNAVGASPSTVVQSSPAAPVATTTDSGHTLDPAKVSGSIATITVPTPGSGVLSYGTHNSLPQQVVPHTGGYHAEPDLVTLTLDGQPLSLGAVHSSTVPAAVISPAQPAQVPASDPASTVEPLQNHKKGSVLQFVGAMLPEPLKLPQEDMWDIFVTFASSTTEVWARLLGDEYSGLYDKTSMEMELHYSGQNIPSANPKKGFLYAVKLDNCWYRCEVLKIEDKEAKVFFIDHGDEEVVPIGELCVLERWFGSLPAQAVKLSLRGLESFANDPNVSLHVGEIIGKSFVAQVCGRLNDGSDVISVRIYDTSTDDDININTVLLEAIGNYALAPQLPPENQLKEMYMSHVTPTGDVYVCLETLSYLESMMRNFLEINVDILHTTNTVTPDPSKIYLAPYALDSKFYRASLTKMLDNNQVEVFFVDYGISEVVSVRSLIPLYLLKKSLAQCPHQVLKVHLYDVPSSMFSLQMADRLRQLVPTTLPVLLKVVQPKGPTGVPVVELFKRIQPNGILASINSTLALGPGLTLGTSADVRSCVEQRTSWSPYCDINGVLPITKLPAEGEYFYVRVSMAAHPGNFTVQPQKDCGLLEIMMHEMQEEYKSKVYPTLEQNAIHVQGLYAALHTDGNWYRARVMNVIKINMVSVYLCDYGNYTVHSLDRLRALHHHFRQLPYQAIRAKLADVRPCDLDWSVEDCLVFQEMVVEREFVSIIRDYSLDAMNVGSAVIGLVLMDGPGEKDIYIQEQLIKQKRALAMSN